MDKGKKIAIAIVVDMALLCFIVFSVRNIICGSLSTTMKNVFSWSIVVAIPIMFFISYMAFVGDKYDLTDEEFDALFGYDEDGQEEDEQGENREEKNSQGENRQDEM